MLNYLINPCYASAVLTLVIGLIVHYLSQYYAAIKNYPPVFRNYKKHWNLELIKLYKIYGPVFTIWIGPWPFVIVCDLDIAKEAFSKVDFSGRPPNDKHTEIAFADYGKTWEALRKVGHSAVRKYAKSAEVSHLVNETVAEVLDAIKDREGIDKPFPAEPYSFNLFANIHMSAIFSQKYKIDQAEMEKFNYCFVGFITDLGNL
ncbi:unnamed protein product [Oppiella nova]|uniref:Cytochrome P450 n=1 Tax=Oppiella nova TaxID=334625 RepID=A0A7R9QR70_9ACAR|nr:unnamed protein product [Oppiella nova]CAG2172687.1 unnamed protein product [Oppiella nova]